MADGPKHEWKGRGGHKGHRGHGRRDREHEQQHGGAPMLHLDAHQKALAMVLTYPALVCTGTGSAAGTYVDLTLRNDGRGAALVTGSTLEHLVDGRWTPCDHPEKGFWGCPFLRGERCELGEEVRAELRPVGGAPIAPVDYLHGEALPSSGVPSVEATCIKAGDYVPSGQSVRLLQVGSFGYGTCMYPGHRPSASVHRRLLHAWAKRTRMVVKYRPAVMELPFVRAKENEWKVDPPQPSTEEARLQISIPR